MSFLQAEESGAFFSAAASAPAGITVGSIVQVVQGYHGEGEYGVVVEDDKSPALPFKVSATVCITLHTACLWCLNLLNPSQ